MTDGERVWLANGAAPVCCKKDHQGEMPDARCQMPDARCQMVKRSLGENFRHQMTPLTGWHTPALPMQEPNRLIARSAPDSSQKRQRFRQQPTKCAKLDETLIDS